MICFRYSKCQAKEGSGKLVDFMFLVSNAVVRRTLYDVLLIKNTSTYGKCLRVLCMLSSKDREAVPVPGGENELTSEKKLLFVIPNCRLYVYSQAAKIPGKM